MRPAPLTTIKGGINRLRVKGGAQADTLYDLLNGYVTESGTVRVRPGSSRDAELDSQTRGLCAFGGELHTFCHKSVAIPDGYVLNIIVHPDPPDADYGYAYGSSDVPIKTIHFAEPFLGGLYVVAEFEDGATYHFWLQPGVSWQASTQYKTGDLVQPTVPNGLLYVATRFGDPNPPWQADEPRYDGVGDAYAQSVVEPTTYNGYYYVCVETQGPNPRSALTEPVWPTFDGGTVIERTDTGLAPETTIDSVPPPPAGSSPVTPVDPVVVENPFDRYDLTSSNFLNRIIKGVQP